MGTDKNEDQVINNNLLKMIQCLRYDVCNNNIDMDSFNKVENIKQNGQTIMISENFKFFKSVIRKFQRLKIMTRAVVYEKIQRFGMDDFFKLFCQNFFQGKLSLLFK